MQPTKIPTTGVELVRNACAESLAALKKWRPASLRLEAEPIHQMRVGTRRLRAILRVFESIMDAQCASELEAELRWLAHLLGAVRDLDVLRDRLREATQKEDRTALRPLQRLLGTRHHDAQFALREGLDSERYAALIERLRIASLAPEVTLDAEGPPLALLMPLTRDAWKKLARSARALKPQSDALKYHSLRKMAKRTRYVSEALLPNVELSHREAAEDFIKQLKHVQDILGEFQDAMVAESTLQLALETGTYRDATIAATKRLRKTQLQAAKQAKKKFPSVWEKTASGKLRKWMRG